MASKTRATISPALRAVAVPAVGSSAPVGALSFLDAAELILRSSGGTAPLHYADITARAIQQRLLSTNGLTPDATMRAAIQRDIEQATSQGRTSRFVRHGNGFIGLSVWLPKGIDHQLQIHNDGVRKALHQKIRQMPPTEFEALIAELLAAMGFQNPTVTKRSGDGGVDVVATLLVGRVIAINMAVQVKRWQNNVQAPTVTALRGSLGVHDHGLIVTTGGFSLGARKEAQLPNKVPIALMKGDELIDLLIEHELEVTRLRHDVLQLKP